MKIGVTAFLTEKSGNPGMIAAAAERAGFEWFWVAEHLVIPAAYTTYYPRSPDGKVPEFVCAPGRSVRRAGGGRAGDLAHPYRHQRLSAARTQSDRNRQSRRDARHVFGWPADAGHRVPVMVSRRSRDHGRRLQAPLASSARVRRGDARVVEQARGELRRARSSSSRRSGFFPKPVQKPYPPIFLGAHDPGPALKRVARWADGWMPGGLSPEKADRSVYRRSSGWRARTDATPSGSSSR